MEPPSLLHDTATVLEWPRLLARLAEHAKSAMGAEYCRRVPLEETVESATVRLRETAEMVVLQDRVDPFPSLPVPDARDAAIRAGKGGVLEPHELRDVATVVGLAIEVVRYLHRSGAQALALSAMAAPLAALSSLRPLIAAIDRSIDEAGHIKESATPELRRISQHAHELKQHMRRRLEVILASARYADLLQEHYFAQREGRYVVPVKAEMRSKVPGIVHDISSSGATVFLEPRELIELNNGIKVSELEVDREVRRVLQSLSADVGVHAESLLAGIEVLARLDAISAKGGLSRRINGRPVHLNAEGRMILMQARHPLLALTKEDIVPNDLILDESIRVLVMSGPNTGGKTVTLKMLGLYALMVRAGLLPSCREDSEMAFFPEVYADIGDAQDLTQNLSSFSAHITQMIHLLRHAAAVERGGQRALVLLDEPVTSTDPAEGAALAEALLRRLAELGMKVVVTTHYNSLKILAHTTPGFLNASVGFDVATLAPTYRVTLGVPGGSSAIEIAGRLGMDEALLDQALQLLRREDRVLERMLSDLQEQQRRLDEQTAEAAARRGQAEQAMREAMELRDRLETAEREQRTRLKKRWTEELLHARAQVQDLLDDVRHQQSVAKAREAKQRLGELDERMRARLAPPGPAVSVEELTVGDRVEIPTLGTAGVLLELPRGRKRVRVRVGDTEMSVATSLLASAPAESRAPSSAPRRAEATLTRAPNVSTETVLDLRGQPADDALEATVAALDRAVLAGSPILRVIHGHGTGRLRTVLRDYLKTSPYVASFRPGERAEGGDGVTIVMLK